MSEPQCGCCKATLWTDAERTVSVCDECLSIALHPHLYQDDPDIDVKRIVRRVNSIAYQRYAKQRV